MADKDKYYNEPVEKYGLPVGARNTQIEHSSSVELARQSHDYALDQMRQSQDYNLSNMAIQNQYAIDAEKRVQAWNDIGAQSSRARAAGISPLAALGSSSGGVLSQSSSPSSSTPGAVGSSSGGRAGSHDASHIANLVQTARQIAQEQQILLESKRVENETKLAESESANIDEDTISKKFENEIKPMLNDLKLDDAETQMVENCVKRMVNSGGTDSVAYRRAYQELQNLVADNGIKESIKQFTDEQINTEKAKQRNIDASTEELGTRSNLNVSKSELNARMSSYYEESTKKAKAEGKLISANTEEAKARKVKIDKEVERIGKQNNLTDEQIRQIKEQIKLNWWKFGVNTAVQVSQEARAWVKPFAKGAKLQDDRSAESWSMDTGYNPFDY